MSDFPAAPPVTPGLAGQAATFGQRLVAVIIDGLLGLAMTIPSIVLFIVAIVIGGGAGTVICILLAVLLYFAAFIAWLYIYFVGLGTEGQTPGKRVQGVKVAKQSGEMIGIGGAFLRWLASSIMNIFLYLGSLWMLWDPEQKTLYDKVLEMEATSVEKGDLFPLFPGGRPF